MDRNKLVKDITNDVTDKDKGIEDDPVALVSKVYDEFMNRQIQNFPDYCAEVYQINKLEDENLRVHGKKGKFTDSYGWSEDMTFKHKWIVTRELKFFMMNLVYKDFWENSNAKARDSFMNQVCKGGTRFDYEQLLKKVLTYYNGANSFKFSDK